MTDENGNVVAPTSAVLTGELPPTAQLTQTLSLGGAGQLQLTNAGKYILVAALLGIAAWFIGRNRS